MLTKTYASRRRSRLPSWLTYSLVALAALAMAVEGYRGIVFVQDVRASKSQLLSIRENLDISRLQQSETDLLAKQQRLRDAQGHLESASSFIGNDPVLFVLRPLPWLGKQTRGLSDLVLAANEATKTGLMATDVALAFSRYERDPNKSSIQDALSFLMSQEQPMAQVAAGLGRLKQHRDSIDDRLYGPMADAKDDLNDAIGKLTGLVEGYERANALLPEVLGYEATRRYLVLPQNDTELFPSGGLISSYGIATFDAGKLLSMDLEYFGTLYDRWQKQTKEYVEPPAPLKGYLKYHYSWGLGEAGWYPDFPTTGNLARSFVAKGGAPETDGVIAIDLQFISALLELLGPLRVPEYGVTVTPENVSELTLELTRDDNYVPGKPSKTFLSHLSKAVLNRVFTAPKDQWVELLRLLDRMGRERHLQLNFVDPDLQGLIGEYGFDGAIDPAKHDGDFLLVADTSVNSTKLNMILNTKASLDLRLSTDGTAKTKVSYQIQNPFPQWKKGRDVKLVKSLMLDGVYGSYLRLYTREQAVLTDALIEETSVGVEQDGQELGKHVFGRFFSVRPGATSSAQFVYETPDVVTKVGKDTYSYKIYIQKEAGTEAIPLEVRVFLPDGAKLKELRLDGKALNVTRIPTDLRTDRVIEVVFITS